MKPGIRRNQYLDVGVVTGVEEDQRISLLATVLQEGVLSGFTGRHEYRPLALCKRLWRRKGKVATVTSSHVYNSYSEAYKRNGIQGSSK